MTLRDGSHFQDFLYIGRGLMHGQVWPDFKGDRERGRPEWRDVPMSLMPADYLKEMLADAEAALRQAA